jgi:hypothetical protein
MSFSIKELTDEPSQSQPSRASQPSQAVTPNTGVQTTPSLVTSPQTAAGTFSVRDLMGDESGQESLETDPRKTGEITNDVGQKVIVPKDGESFADTMKRAVTYHKSLTPEQQQAALDAETKTIPKKTAETLGAAATIGAVGPALLAAPGELAEALPSVLTHTVDGVKAIGTWATKNPVQAYLLFQVMKELVPGAKKAIGIVKGVPEVE